MRTCKVFKKVATTHPTTGRTVFETVLEGEAIFHAFSMDHEEYDQGPGNIPVAIVEFPDGSLASRYVEMVRFNEPTEVDGNGNKPTT